MSRILLATLLAAGLCLPAAVARAQAARLGEIADAWVLQTHGHLICRLTLSGRASKAGLYRADIPADCQSALPAGAAGWKPTPDGLALVGADGGALITFNRWSESLFVSTGSGPDLQMARASLSHKER